MFELANSYSYIHDAGAYNLLTKIRVNPIKKICQNKIKTSHIQNQKIFLTLTLAYVMNVMKLQRGLLQHGCNA